MPFFYFSTTNLKYDNVNLDELISLGTSKVARTLGVDKKYVTLQINAQEASKKRKLTQSNNTDSVMIQCYITYFKELTADVDASLRQAATAFHALIENRFHIKGSELTITLTPHLDRVLVDWRRRNTLVASTPVQDQEETSCCWAYALADFLGTCYAITNPLLTTCEQFRCAPYDLVDWVYSIKQLKKKYAKNDQLPIDEYGTYPCHSVFPVDYVRKYGISLLKNYDVEIGKRTLRTDRTIEEFEDMLLKRGPRIFFKKSRLLKPDDGSKVLDIEAVHKILHQGVAFGEIKVCNGCDHCTGFSNFEGKGLYEEPSHPKDHNKYGLHALLVLGVGNKDGKDYVRVRNAHGPSWGHRGIGDIPIKHFLRIRYITGVEKKTWDGKEWVLVDV